MTDEREHKPSASNLHRVLACPGFWQLWQARMALAEKTGDETRNEAAQKGTEIHQAIAEESELKGYDEHIRTQCISIADKKAKEILGDGPLVRMVEKRLWLYSADGARIMSCRVDRMETDSNGKWLIVDFKTLPGDQDPADRNWQLAAAAVTLNDDVEARQRLPVTEVYVAIVQPSVTDNPIIAHYGEHELITTRRFVLRRVEEIYILGVPRIPGHHCKYCPVAAHCIQCQALMPVIKGMNVAFLKPEQLPGILDRLPIIRDICNKVEDRALSLLQANPACLPGYTLGQTSPRRKPFKAKALYPLIQDVVPKAEFQELMQVTVADAQAVFAGHYSKQNDCLLKEADNAFLRLTKPIEESSTPQPKLVKVVTPPQPPPA